MYFRIVNFLTMDMYLFMNNKVVFKIGIKDRMLNGKQNALGSSFNSLHSLFSICRHVLMLPNHNIIRCCKGSMRATCYARGTFIQFEQKVQWGEPHVALIKTESDMALMRTTTC